MSQFSSSQQAVSHKNAAFLSAEATMADGFVPLGPSDLLLLARNRSPEGRTLLANTVTELLEGTPSDKESALISDILLQLVHDAELDLRRTLSEKLARNPNAPHELMLFLAHDDISVANPILVLSQVLKDQDLIDVVRQRSTYHRRAVARRPELPDAVQQVLVLSNDNDAIETLLYNENTHLTGRVLAMLLETVKETESLRQPLVERAEVTTEFAVKLYWWISIELRSYIEQRFKVDRGQIDQALESTLQTMLTNSFRMAGVTPAMMEVAHNLASSGKISSGLLIQTLRRGQSIPFSALFSAWLNLPVGAIDKMILSHSGETMALAVKAMHMQKADFASLFLLARAARPGEQLVDPKELSRVLEFFDRLPHYMAKSILQRWQADPLALQQNNFNMANLIVETNQSYLQ